MFVYRCCISYWDYTTTVVDELVYSVGGMVVTGEDRRTRRRVFPLSPRPPQIWYGRYWNRTWVSAVRDGLLPDNCEVRKHSVVFTELIAIRHKIITSFCALSECCSQRTAAQAVVIYIKVRLVCVFNLWSSSKYHCNPFKTYIYIYIYIKHDPFCHSNQ